MYGILIYIWAIFGVNVGKYSIHGASGMGFMGKSLVSNPLPKRLSRPAEASWDTKPVPSWRASARASPVVRQMPRCG